MPLWRAGATAKDPDAGLPLVPEYDAMRVLESHDGGTIYTISRGDGPPVVFCHGVTLSSPLGEAVRGVPRRGFRAVAFDSRGHGESVAGETGHSIDNLADDVRSVLEGLDLRDVVLVGHSMGGMAVQAFAIRHPDVLHEHVCGLVLQSTASHNLVSDTRRVREALERLSRWDPTPNCVHASPNLGFLLARIGFGDYPHPSSRTSVTRDAHAACSLRHDPRRRHRAAEPRPHRWTARRSTCRPSCWWGPPTR